MMTEYLSIKLAELTQLRNLGFNKNLFDYIRYFIVEKQPCLHLSQPDKSVF